MADALSWQPDNPDSLSESSDEERRNGKLLHTEMVCQILDHHLDSVKLPYSVKYEIQTSITDVDIANSSKGSNLVNVIDMCN